MEQPDGATEANQRDEILRSFSAGGAYSKRRDLWLVVSARNSETRSQLRNDGILHLADVLQRDDFDAVECLAKVWSRSKVERESSSKALGVTVFKANEAQSYGGKAKYLMFGSSPPGDLVTGGAASHLCAGARGQGRGQGGHSGGGRSGGAGAEVRGVGGAAPAQARHLELPEGYLVAGQENSEAG